MGIFTSETPVSTGPKQGKKPVAQLSGSQVFHASSDATSAGTEIEKVKIIPPSESKFDPLGTPAWIKNQEKQVGGLRVAESVRQTKLMGAPEPGFSQPDVGETGKPSVTLSSEQGKFPVAFGPMGASPDTLSGRKAIQQIATGQQTQRHGEAFTGIFSTPRPKIEAQTKTQLPYHP